MVSCVKTSSSRILNGDCRNEERLEPSFVFEGHSLGVVSVDINNEGKIAATSSLDSHIRFWNLETGEEERNIDAGPVDAWTVCYSPDSTLIATGSHNKSINLYNAKDARFTARSIRPARDSR